jgi:hypothetical protein
MALALKIVGQPSGANQLFPGTPAGKLLTAFDKELGLLLNPNETFEAGSKRHLIIDLAVLRAIDAIRNLTKATDGNSKTLKAWIIEQANVEKARRFGHDVNELKAALKVLNDLKVPDFNALQTKGMLGIRLDIDENTSVPEIAPVVPTFTSPSGLSTPLKFSTALVPPTRTPVPFGSSSSSSASSKLQLSRSDRDKIIRDFEYDPSLISAEYVNGKPVSGELEPGRIYNVILLNSQNTRDDGKTKEVKFKKVEFDRREDETLIFLGGRRTRLPVHLQERHYAFLGEPKTLPHAVFPRASIGFPRYPDDDVYSAARTLAAYGVRGFNDSPQWITTSARGIPEPVAHFMGRSGHGISPDLTRGRSYTLITDFGNVYQDRSGKTASGVVHSGELYESGSGIYDFNGCVLDPGFPGKVFILEVSPLEDPLPISKVNKPVLLSNTKVDENDFRTQNYILEQVVQKLDSDKTYLFLQKGKKPQIGRPVTYWTTSDRRNERASVVILTKEGRAIQTHTGSATVAIPLDLNQGSVLDEAKLIDDIDTVRRLHNEPMPNESDLKIALGISKAPIGISHSSPSSEDRAARNRWPSDMRGRVSSSRGRNGDIFTATGGNDGEVIDWLNAGQTVGFQSIADDGFSDELLAELQQNFTDAKVLMNGQEGIITSFRLYGICISYTLGGSECVDLEDVHRLQILGRSDDDLAPRTNVTTRDVFLARGHSDDEIVGALKAGKAISFINFDRLDDRHGIGIDLKDRLSASFEQKALINGNEEIVSFFDFDGIVLESGIAFYEDIERLQIPPKGTDVITNSDFLARGRSDVEIREALEAGKVVDFAGVEFFTDPNLDQVLMQGKVLFNGDDGIIENVYPRGIEIKLDKTGFTEYKSLAEQPFKLQLLKNETKAFVGEPKSIIVQPGDDPGDLSRNLEAGHTLEFPAGVNFDLNILHQMHRSCDEKKIQINGEVLNVDHSPFVVGNYFLFPGNDYCQVREGSLTLKIVD